VMLRLLLLLFTSSSVVGANDEAATRNSPRSAISNNQIELNLEFSCELLTADFVAKADAAFEALRNEIAEMRRENESLEKRVRSAEAANTQTQAGLEQATSLIRSDIDELRSENESLREHLDQVNTRIAAGSEQATSAVSETNATVTALRGDIKELRRENESLHNELNEIRVILEEQEEASNALPPTSSIGFDDVTTTTNSSALIPNGYHGLNWDNVELNHRSRLPGAGYEYGIVSGDFAAFNADGEPCSISSATPFSVAGFQATGAYMKYMNVLIESFDLLGTQIGSFATTLGHPRDGPNFIDLRREGTFEGLFKLKITTSGGADADLGFDFCTDCKHLVIDDLQVY